MNVHDGNQAFRAYTEVLQSCLPWSEPEALVPSTNLLDLGLDSLNTVELLVRLEEALGIQLPDEELTAETFESVGSLWAVLVGTGGSTLRADIVDTSPRPDGVAS